jgi:hypothetical protein
MAALIPLGTLALLSLHGEESGAALQIGAIQIHKDPDFRAIFELLRNGSAELPASGVRQKPSRPPGHGPIAVAATQRCCLLMRCV